MDLKKRRRLQKIVQFSFMLWLKECIPWDKEESEINFEEIFSELALCWPCFPTINYSACLHLLLRRSCLDFCTKLPNTKLQLVLPKENTLQQSQEIFR